MALSVVAPSPELGAAEVVSGVQQEKSTFQWKIQGFDVVHKSDYLVKEQRFQFEAGQSIGVPTSWECFMESARRRDGKKWMGVFIGYVGGADNVKELNVSSTFQIMKPDGDIYFMGKAPVRNMMNPDTKQGGWGFRYIIPYDAPTEALPLFDGSLIIDIEFVLHGTKRSYNKIKLGMHNQLKSFEVKSVFKLSKDLERMNVLAGGNANVMTTIVSMDQVEIPVNRGILAARSPVFRAMFQVKMKESQTGKVILGDLSSKSIKVMLHYICCGRLPPDWKCDDVMEELTIAAHRYELKLLTEFLDGVLGRVCTLGNAKRMALVAQKLGMKRAEMDLFNLIKNSAKSLEELVVMDSSS